MKKLLFILAFSSLVCTSCNTPIKEKLFKEVPGTYIQAFLNRSEIPPIPDEKNPWIRICRHGEWIYMQKVVGPFFFLPNKEEEKKLNDNATESNGIKIKITDPEVAKVLDLDSITSEWRFSDILSVYAQSAHNALRVDFSNLTIGPVSSNKRKKSPNYYLIKFIERSKRHR